MQVQKPLILCICIAIWEKRFCSEICTQKYANHGLLKVVPTQKPVHTRCQWIRISGKFHLKHLELIRKLHWLSWECTTTYLTTITQLFMTQLMCIILSLCKIKHLRRGTYIRSWNSLHRLCYNVLHIFYL